jgi:predicted O-methyltransferase YrrM
VVACDVSEKPIATGRCYREEAGVSDRVDLQFAAALEVLDGLLAADQEVSFEFAFIDAGKIREPAQSGR